MRGVLRSEKRQPDGAAAKLVNRARWGEPIQAERFAGVSSLIRFPFGGFYLGIFEF